MMLRELQAEETHSMRLQRPDLAGYVDDFYTALTYPHAFDWHRMPGAWRQAQSLLSSIWHRWGMLQRRLF